ncbi:hypothetical protein PIB30_015680 [Stylosanthes scabra]|uniref:Uncharacterized protein n=1 Tax=Stylosanthes scabra TaxID=79078 RepID=A0ABU6U8T4_9FABA|nr:hypothetical protein [Stylosanthes scabra]
MGTEGKGLKANGIHSPVIFLQLCVCSRVATINDGGFTRESCAKSARKVSGRAREPRQMDNHIKMRRAGVNSAPLPQVSPVPTVSRHTRRFRLGPLWDGNNVVENAHVSVILWLLERRKETNKVDRIQEPGCPQVGKGPGVFLALLASCERLPKACTFCNDINYLTWRASQQHDRRVCEEDLRQTPVHRVLHRCPVPGRGSTLLTGNLQNRAPAFNYNRSGPDYDIVNNGARTHTATSFSRSSCASGPAPAHLQDWGSAGVAESFSGLRTAFNKLANAFQAQTVTVTEMREDIRLLVQNQSPSKQTQGK